MGLCDRRMVDHTRKKARVENEYTNNIVIISYVVYIVSSGRVPTRRYYYATYTYYKYDFILHFKSFNTFNSYI